MHACTSLCLRMCVHTNAVSPFNTSHHHPHQRQTPPPPPMTLPHYLTNNPTHTNDRRRRFPFRPRRRQPRPAPWPSARRQVHGRGHAAVRGYVHRDRHVYKHIHAYVTPRVMYVGMNACVCIPASRPGRLPIGALTDEGAASPCQWRRQRNRSAFAEN